MRSHWLADKMAQERGYCYVTFVTGGGGNEGRRERDATKEIALRQVAWIPNLKSVPNADKGRIGKIGKGEL